jgi:hypothetical protein
MFGISLMEWIGYLASVLVLISLLMSSIVKLRWINLVGSAVFSFYGFSIGALPVGIMNLVIVAINIYYLIKMYSAKDYFKILPVEENSRYTEYFLKFYDAEIKKYFSQNDFKITDYNVGFYILRNMVPAGIFLASRQDDKTLLVALDFVIPEYRDFKIGKYLFDSKKDIFLESGYTRLASYSHNDKHAEYLLKMGFAKKTEGGNEVFIKEII